MQDEIVIKNKLKLARVEKNLSQEELADKVGVTRQTIGAIENEIYTPSVKLAFALSKALGKGINEIFFIEGSSK